MGNASITEEQVEVVVDVNSDSRRSEPHEVPEHAPSPLKDSEAIEVEELIEELNEATDGVNFLEDDHQRGKDQRLATQATLRCQVTVLMGELRPNEQVIVSVVEASNATKLALQHADRAEETHACIHPVVDAQSDSSDTRLALSARVAACRRAVDSATTALGVQSSRRAANSATAREERARRKLLGLQLPSRLVDELVHICGCVLHLRLHLEVLRTDEATHTNETERRKEEATHRVTVAMLALERKSETIHEERQGKQGGGRGGDDGSGNDSDFMFEDDERNAHALGGSRSSSRSSTCSSGRSSHRSRSFGCSNDIGGGGGGGGSGGGGGGGGGGGENSSACGYASGSGDGLRMRALTDDGLRTAGGAQGETGISAARAAVGRLLRRYTASTPVPVQGSGQEVLQCLDRTLAISYPSDGDRLSVPRPERLSFTTPLSTSIELPRALRKRFTRERFHALQPETEEGLVWLQWRECLESTLAATAPSTDATTLNDIPVPAAHLTRSCSAPPEVSGALSSGGLLRGVARLFARRKPPSAQPPTRPAGPGHPTRA